MPDLSRTPLYLHDVTVTYPEQTDPAVAGLDLELWPGEMVALTGPSGSGKSTVLALILGFVVAESGVVVAGASAADEFAPTVWRQQFAWVPQRPGLRLGTVADNVRLGRPDASDDDVVKALDAAGARELSLETPVGERGESLSGGQQRRVALARALLTDASVLLLDEPTAGLDAETEAEVIAGLRAAGRTVLLVAHRPALIAAADRVVEVRPAAKVEPKELVGS